MNKNIHGDFQICISVPLMNILNMSFYNYFLTKKSLNDTPYRKFRKFSLYCKQHFKTRKELSLN